jgi:hypothetical protein
MQMATLIQRLTIMNDQDGAKHAAEKHARNLLAVVSPPWAR